MPVYDYECAECGAFELVRRIVERNENAACPQCGATARRVVIGAPSLSGDAGGALDESAGSYGMRHSGSCLCCR
ncbi:zinc ribbon domain-containing protein [Paraburkholderia sp. PREW-6R]|uniref:FmdB family zinc ribbon protein n=1 Tax=Paraburkholderia sp. PREW-6R TaxID=3141544 RepID=UPI0031F4C598